MGGGGGKENFFKGRGEVGGGGEERRDGMGWMGMKDGKKAGAGCEEIGGAQRILFAV